MTATFAGTGVKGEKLPLGSARLALSYSAGKKTSPQPLVPACGYSPEEFKASVSQSEPVPTPSTVGRPHFALDVFDYLRSLLGVQVALEAPQRNADYVAVMELRPNPFLRG